MSASSHMFESESAILPELASYATRKHKFPGHPIAGKSAGKQHVTAARIARKNIPLLLDNGAGLFIAGDSINDGDSFSRFYGNPFAGPITRVGGGDVLSVDATGHLQIDHADGTHTKYFDPTGGVPASTASVESGLYIPAADPGAAKIAAHDLRPVSPAAPALLSALQRSLRANYIFGPIHGRGIHHAATLRRAVVGGNTNALHLTLADGGSLYVRMDASTAKQLDVWSNSTVTGTPTIFSNVTSVEIDGSGTHTSTVTLGSGFSTVPIEIYNGVIQLDTQGHTLSDLAITGNGTVTLGAARVGTDPAAPAPMLNVLGTLSMPDRATLRLSGIPGTNKTAVAQIIGGDFANQISIAPTAMLDLADRSLLTNASTNAVQAAVAAGYNASAYGNEDGAWDGGGISSGLAKTFFDPNGGISKYSVGYAYGGDASVKDQQDHTGDNTNHNLDGVGATQTLVRPVLTGDVNMDGVVDVNDITSIQGYHYEDGHAGRYTDGDVANHGIVNSDDISFVLAANYNSKELLGFLRGASADVTAATNISVTAGQAFSGQVATFNVAAPGSLAAPLAGDFTAIVTWGNGASSTTGTVSGDDLNGFTVSADIPASNFAAAGSLPFTVSVTHASGLVSTQIGSIEIAPRPAPPTNLQIGTVSPDGITLAWQSNSSNEDGFNIEWSNDGATFYTIDTVASGTTVYTDSDPVYNQANYYRISAYRGSSNSSPTNIVNGKPTTAPENFDDENGGFNGRNTLSPYSVVHDHTLTVSAVNGLLTNDMTLAGTSIHIADHTQPAHGALDLNGDGSFIYTPAAGYVGTDTFTYSTADGFNTSTNVGVAIDVTNAIPVAPDVTISQPFTNPNGQLQASDGDGDHLTYSIIQQPQHGTVSLDSQTGNFTYNVNSDFMGSDSFKYIANDGLRDSNAGEVTIGSFVHHDAIAASDYQLLLQPGGSEQLPLVPRITLATPWQIVGGGAVHGTATLQNTSSGQLLSYIPNGGFTGDDSVQISHSLYGTDVWSKPFTVGFHVSDANPVSYWHGDANFLLAASNTVRGTYSQTITNLPAPDSGATLTLSQNALHGTVQLTGTGGFTYTPAPDPSGKPYFGWDLFKITITQPWGQTLDQWIELNVGNYAPPTAANPADKIDPSTLPDAMQGVWADYKDATQKLGVVFKALADLGKASADVKNPGIDYDTSETAALAKLDAVNQAFASYAQAYQHATITCGNYMRGVLYTSQPEYDLEMAIQGLPLDVAGVQPTKGQLQKWQFALGTFAAGADFQMANGNFNVVAATEVHDALNKSIRYAGVASLAVTGGQLLVKEGCAAFARAALAQMYSTAQGVAVGIVANNAAAASLALAQRFGIQVDPDYLRIGADAVQLFSLLMAAKAQRTAAGANCFAAGALIDTKSGETPIENLHIGQRVLTQVDNPFAKGAPLNAVGDPNATAVDPATWRAVTFDMPDPKQPGNDYRMQLLEPLSWIAQNAAKAGSWVQLKLPELQINGLARVDAVDACPTIQPGVGRVLLGTFEHVSHDLVDVKFTGDATDLRVTSGHKLWSLDRGDWVQVGALNIGEHLASERGSVTVSSITAESVVVPVYNLDVEIDHRYFVGPDDVLAHNAGLCDLNALIGKKVVAPSPKYPLDAGTHPAAVGRDGTVYVNYHHGAAFNDAGGRNNVLATGNVNLDSSGNIVSVDLHFINPK